MPDNDKKDIEIPNEATYDPHAVQADLYPWSRLLYLVFFFVVFEVLRILTVLSSVFQFIVGKSTGKTNEGIRDFGTRMAAYSAEVVQYLTFASEEPPYPFGAPPAGGQQDQ